MRKRKGMKEDVLFRLREFLEDEVRSGSMDFVHYTSLRLQDVGRCYPDGRY